MALTTDPFDATELVAFISETWTPKTLEEYFAKAVASNFFLDLSSYASGGSDIFHVPDVYSGAFTANTQSTQGAEVTTEAPLTVDVTLTVNTHKYISTLLGYKDMVQIANVYNINEVYARKAGGTLMEDLEAAIFALHSSVSTNTINDTASVISDADVRTAIEKLMTADLPREECAFFFHPYSYWVQVHAIQKYYDASQAGWNGSGLVRTGNFGSGNTANALMGKLFGFDIYQSSKVVNTLLGIKNLFAHKDALAFATQTRGGSRVQFQAQNWLANLGVLAVWDTIYGVVATRETSAVVLNGSNAFIAS